MDNEPLPWTPPIFITMMVGPERGTECKEGCSTRWPRLKFDADLETHSSRTGTSLWMVKGIHRSACVPGTLKPEPGVSYGLRIQTFSKSGTESSTLTVGISCGASEKEPTPSCRDKPGFRKAQTECFDQSSARLTADARGQLVIEIRFSACRRARRGGDPALA